MEKYKVWNEHNQYLGVWSLTEVEFEDLVERHPFWRINGYQPQEDTERTL